MRLGLLLLLAACGGATRERSYRLEAPAADAARFERLVASGAQVVTAHFGAPYPRAFVVRVYGDRAAMTARMRELWKEPSFEAQCWMVGMGMATELLLLSPSRWRTEACEHDPDDELGLAALVTHELVHVYHSQRNARLESDAEAFEPLGWLVEGLAVHVSGQARLGKHASPEEAIRAGAAPARLADAWSGKYRYGVSGSLVAHVEKTYGRAAIVRLLTADSEAGVLRELGVTEAQLLEAWRASVVTTDPAPAGR